MGKNDPIAVPFLKTRTLKKKTAFFFQKYAVLAIHFGPWLQPEGSYKIGSVHTSVRHFVSLEDCIEL